MSLSQNAITCLILPELSCPKYNLSWLIGLIIIHSMFYWKMKVWSCFSHAQRNILSITVVLSFMISSVLICLWSIALLNCQIGQPMLENFIKTCNFLHLLKSLLQHSKTLISICIPQCTCISVALRETAVACVWRPRGSFSVVGAVWRAAVPYASIVPCPIPTPAVGFTSPAQTSSAPTLESQRWVTCTVLTSLCFFVKLDFFWGAHGRCTISWTFG